MAPTKCKIFIQSMAMLWWAALFVEGIRFDVKRSDGSKCVSEEIHTNAIVLVNFSVANQENGHEPHNISLKVTSAYGNSLHHTENVAQGQFGFTAHESGSYVACFWIPNSSQEAVVTVDLDWKAGVAAKDWETIARKEKIE
ncbi:hypothetical protein KI387_031304, partial [Taxus chinensis]